MSATLLAGAQHSDDVDCAAPFYGTPDRAICQPAGDAMVARRLYYTEHTPIITREATRRRHTKFPLFIPVSCHVRVTLINCLVVIKSKQQLCDMQFRTILRTAPGVGRAWGSGSVCIIHAMRPHILPLYHGTFTGPEGSTKRLPCKSFQAFF